MNKKSLLLLPVMMVGLAGCENPALKYRPDNFTPTAADLSEQNSQIVSSRRVQVIGTQPAKIRQQGEDGFMHDNSAVTVVFRETYKTSNEQEGARKTYTVVQPGKLCEYDLRKPFVGITTAGGDTRIQPNSHC